MSLIQPAASSAELFYPRVDFNLTEFHKFIDTRGYNVTIEQAHRCPCKAFGGENIPSCRNCGGRGWLFINKTQTKVLLTNMGQKFIQNPMNEKLIGSASISCKNAEDLGYMDRISLIDGRSQYSEVVYLNHNSIFHTLTGSTIYEIVSVICVFVYKSTNTALIRLTPDQYTVSSNKITIQESVLSAVGITDCEDVSFSIRYKHKPTYHVTDMLRETFVSFELDELGNDKAKQMPIHAMSRKSEYLFEELNIKTNSGSSTNLIDNSYTPTSQCSNL